MLTSKTIQEPGKLSNGMMKNLQLQGALHRDRGLASRLHVSLSPQTPVILLHQIITISSLQIVFLIVDLSLVTVGLLPPGSLLIYHVTSAI